MSWEPELVDDAAGPVTATVTRRVKPGHEPDYEEFLAGINGAAKAFPGYLGEEVFRPAGGAGARRAARRRPDAHRVPHRAGELVHSPHAARWPPAAPLQDGHPHLGDDLPPHHAGRRRLGAAHRGPAAGSPARGDDAGDRVADDVGGHAARDMAAAPVAVSRPPLTCPLHDLGGFPCSVNTQSM